MKKHTLIIFLLLNFHNLPLFALNNDSLTYEQQRKKINDMLNKRSSHFGEYAESLNNKTGIFGLKTKKDMQKSIDILADIIQTDNAILKETKVLVDYKNIQQEKLATEHQENNEKNLAYMRTINKLQTENERLNNELILLQDSYNSFKTFTYLFSTLAALLFLLSFRKFYSKKR